MNNGDIFIDASTGRPALVTGPEKSAQDIAEILLTLLVPEKYSRSYSYFPRDYGSELAYIQTPIEFAGLVGKPLISKKIQESIARLQRYQKSDTTSTTDERINKIVGLDVNQVNTSDFTFLLEVMLEGGSPLELAKRSPTALNHLVLSSSYRDSRRTSRIR